MGISFQGHRLLRLHFAAVVVGSLIYSAGAEIPCGYEVTAIMQGPWCNDSVGFPPTRATGLNEAGDVVGFYTRCTIGPDEAFVWRPGLGFFTLNRPPGFAKARASDVDGQQVVGTMWMNNLRHAVLWSGGQVIELGTMPGGDFSEAMAVNGERIVGNWGNSAVGPFHGFVWQAGVMVDLGSTLGADSSSARDVNDKGTVVGWLEQNAGDERIAYVLQQGIVTILGPIPGGFRSEATAVNSSTGQVVGSGRRLDEKTGDLLVRAFLWDDGGMIDLGSLPGFQHSAATDVSDTGLVVGGLYGGAAGALIWDDGIMMDLNDLIPSDASVHVDIAWAINSQGKIACQGTDLDGDVVGLLLTPVEPTPGDLTCDGHVLLDDFTLLLDAWGPCPADNVCPADLDGDGSVGIVDFLMLLANWG